MDFCLGLLATKRSAVPLEFKQIREIDGKPIDGTTFAAKSSLQGIWPKTEITKI
jgi:hypothetical protein